MEQKTEASQAVDERAEMIEALRACVIALEHAGTGSRTRGIAQTNAADVLARAALKARPVPTEAAQGEDSARLADGYKSSTMVSDFYGPKVTLHYETTAQADAAHDTLVSMIERASAETGGVKS